MGLLDELYGLSPEGAADLEFRKGAKGLESGRTPGGIQGLLGDVSEGSDKALAFIAEAEKQAKASGARQSPVGWLLGQIMAGIGPSMVGSAARVAKAPMDYAQGRDVDLRGSDALLALPVAGPAGRAAAPALRMSPETAGILATGGAGFGYGYGVADEANADSGGRVTMPTQRSRAEFEQGYNVPRPTLRSIDEAAKAARAAYEQSAAYKGLVDQKRAVAAGKQADRIEAEARANYAGEQATHEKQLKDWEAAREGAWTAEQGDYDSRLKAFQNQGFWDRNPEVKPYAMGAAYALPALFGAGTAIQRGRTQQRLTDAIMGDDIARAAAASQAAQKYLNPTVGQQAMKATGTVLAAGAPFELRSIGDAADAVFAPEGSGAKERAQKHFADPLKYVAEGAPQLVTGAMLYGMGNKAGSLVTRDAKSMLAGAASPEAQAAIEQAAARRVAGIQGQGRVDQAAHEAALQNVKNRGLLAEESGNAALAERSSAEARRRIAQPSPGLLDDAAPPVQSAPATVSPQRPPPQPAPSQNPPALPAPAKEPREWAQFWSAPAREAVQEHIATGAPLSALTASKLVDMINARLPKGVPEAKLSTTRGYLANLKTDLGAAPSERELMRQFAVDPKRFALPIGLGAGASGLLDWGD